jgi:hypothetical protein
VAKVNGDGVDDVEADIDDDNDEALVLFQVFADDDGTGTDTSGIIAIAAVAMDAATADPVDDKEDFLVAVVVEDEDEEVDSEEDDGVNAADVADNKARLPADTTTNDTFGSAAGVLVEVVEVDVAADEALEDFCLTFLPDDEAVADVKVFAVVESPLLVDDLSC